MRNNVNSTYQDGVLIDQVVVPWTLEDYDNAISSSPQELDSLIDERSVLVGKSEMIKRVDQVADSKRMEFLGDVTRAFEYQAAERDAKLYAANNFQGEVPLAVQAWADAVGFSAEDAAKNILQESALYNYALNAIRAIRLQAKQSIMRETDFEIVKQIYFQALTSIRSIGQ